MFDDWGDPAAPVAPVEAAAVAEPGDGDGGLISKDAFFAAFRFAFQAPNFVIRPPLASLEIEEGDREARAASDAFYDTCCDVPWLNFLVKPSSVWAERAAVIGLFAFGKGQAVLAELSARKDKPGAEPVEGPKPTGAGEAAPSPSPETVRPAHVDMEILNPAKAQAEAA